MRKDKEDAIKLRLEGKSYSEISEALTIPQGTLSGWFGREDWSEKIRQHLSDSSKKGNSTRLIRLNSVRGKKLADAYETAREEARNEFELLKYDPVFISGIMLYWGEGSKSERQGVKFASSDPKKIRLYVSFLRNACLIPIENIKAYVLIYPQIEEKTCRAYWSKMVNVPWENFTPSVVLTGREASKRLGWGVCTITVSNMYFKQKMLEWIKLLSGELLGEA
ncbi:MAG: hypothetical protein ACHQU0_00260 [Candidatus Paceibacteria bacterium]